MYIKIIIISISILFIFDKDSIANTNAVKVEPEVIKNSNALINSTLEQNSKIYSEELFGDRTYTINKNISLNHYLEFKQKYNSLNNPIFVVVINDSNDRSKEIIEYAQEKRAVDFMGNEKIKKESIQIPIELASKKASQKLKNKIEDIFLKKFIDLGVNLLDYNRVIEMSNSQKSDHFENSSPIKSIGIEALSQKADYLVELNIRENDTIKMKIISLSSMSLLVADSVKIDHTKDRYVFEDKIYYINNYDDLVNYKCTVLFSKAIEHLKSSMF